MPYDRQWVADAISMIEADFNRSADTHLIRLDLPKLGNIGLYLKDESTHPVGQFEAPVGAIIVFVWAVQWLDHQGHADHRSVKRIDSGIGSLFCKTSRASFYCRDAEIDIAAKDRSDRLLWRRMSSCGP